MYKLNSSTEATGNHWFPVALLLFTAFHLWLSTMVPPAEDELYYWSWAQTLQGSYYDHPPMVAYLIRLSTAWFGDSIGAIRLFSCLLGTLSVWLIGTLCRTNKQMVSFLLFTPLFLVGSVLMTPDIPLAFFWIAYIVWLTSCNRTLAEWGDDPVTRVYRSRPVSYVRWVLGGTILGLGILSKYTMLLAIPCAFLALIAKHRGKAWLTGFALHLGIAFVITLPVLVYNYHLDFLPLKFQWTHSMSTVDFSISRFFGFLGTQTVLVGALPFLMLPWVIAKGRDLTADPRLHVSFYFYLLPMLFFLFQAAKSPMEANWPLVSYLSFWPLAQRLLDVNSFQLLGRSIMVVGFSVPLLVSLLLPFASHFPRLMPPEKNRVARLKSQFNLTHEVAERVKELERETGAPLPIYLSNYQWTSYFRFQKLDAWQLPPTARHSHFTLPGKDPCAETRLVTLEPSDERAPASLGCFTHREPIGEYPIKAGEKEVGRLNLVRYSR